MFNDFSEAGKTNLTGLTNLDQIPMIIQNSNSVDTVPRIILSDFIFTVFVNISELFF